MLWGVAQLPAVIISNPAEYESKRRALIAGGATALQVIADFDRTLTTAFANTGVPIYEPFVW